MVEFLVILGAAVALSIILTLITLIALHIIVQMKNNKRLKEDCEPTTWQPPTLVENVIGSVNDWEILAYYTPKVFDWLQGKIELSEADKAACQQLRERLETSCQWKDKNNQLHAGVPRIEYEAINIMNDITNKSLIISWKGNEVIAGTWIDFGAYSEYIQVEDSE